MMNRREFLVAAGGLAACCGAARAAADTSKRPPNFLVILADDLGARELGCYGHPAHQTPNLDALGAAGVRFETAYTATICHPTRVMMLTGQYGCHNGVLNFAGRRGGPDPKSPVEDIGKNHTTFAEVLKERGYATALAGKWQLSGEVPTLIHDCGFDEYCIWAYAHDLPAGVKHTGGFENDKGKTARYWHPCIMKNGQYVETTPDQFGPDIHRNFLIDFMRRNRERPFLAYYPMCLVHGPLYRTPDTKDLPDLSHDTKTGLLKDNVEYMDKEVGLLTAALEELGLRENTVVIFTGDNGPAGNGKGEATELGARVPMIINAPGMVKQCGATRELTDMSDIFPTLAAFAGAALPKDKVIDGHSLASFLGGETEKTRDWIFSFIGDRRILRSKRWLLEDNSPGQFGRLYDCGGSVDGTGYKEVTASQDPEVAAVKAEFAKILEGLPAPVLPDEGGPKDRKPGRGMRRGSEKGGGDAREE